MSSLSVYVGDSIIQQSSKVRDLGVIFDQFLSFDDYISYVCRSTHFHLRNIGRIRHLLSHHATAQLIHALISTRLDYCNSVQYNLPKSSIFRLQRIQNQAARILTRTPRQLQRSASAPDFERADEGSILTAGICFKSGKSECNNSGYKLTGLTWWP